MIILRETVERELLGKHLRENSLGNIGKFLSDWKFLKETVKVNVWGKLLMLNMSIIEAFLVFLSESCTSMILFYQWLNQRIKYLFNMCLTLKIISYSKLIRKSYRV